MHSRAMRVVVEVYDPPSCAVPAAAACGQPAVSMPVLDAVAPPQVQHRGGGSGFQDSHAAGPLCYGEHGGVYASVSAGAAAQPPADDAIETLLACMAGGQGPTDWASLFD